MAKRNEWITLVDDDGERRRYNLASMTALDISVRQDSWATGVELEQVYLMPRSKRVILQTYSIWGNGRNDGRITGRQYHIAEPDTIAKLHEESGDERLLAMIPEGEC